jgi:hypothetical protein
MTISINKKSALGIAPNADPYMLSKSYFKIRNKKIQPEFPKKANPLFCTFDGLVAAYINRVGFCYLLRSRDYLTYDLNFSKGKDIWIFYFYEAYRELSINFGYELLRHGAMKVLVDWFPLTGVSHD